MHAATVDAAPVARRNTYERHPSDLIHLLLACALVALGFLLATVASDGVRNFDDDLIQFVTNTPSSVRRIFVEGVQLLALVLPLVAVAVLVVLRRFRALGYALVAGIAAGVVAHLTVGFFAVAVFLRVVTGTTLATDLVLALGLGWAAGAGTLLAFGSPMWTPNVDDIEDAMARSGVPLADLEPASVDARGSVPWFGRAADGRQVFVKTEGRDQRSGDLLFRLYRFVRSKNLGDQRPFSSLRRTVEHEGFVALAAANVGVRTPPFLAVATIGPSEDAFLLAYERIEGSSLDAVDHDAVTDDMLRALWEQVRLLRCHRIAHRDLRFANVFLADDGAPWIIDFGFSELAASDRLLAMDVAQFLVASAIAVGSERAVAAANEVLGPDALAAALPLVQPGGLPSATRHQLGRGSSLLNELHHEVQRVTGVGQVHLEPLVRVRTRTVVMMLVLGVAIYVLYPQLADLGQTMQDITDASLGWVFVALVFSALTYVGATVSLLGSVPDHIPVGPTFLAQLASSFANRITPASAGGYAVNVRFLQREGVDGAVAVTGVGLDTLGSVLVHIPLLLVFLAWAGERGNGPFSVPSARTFLFIALGFALISLAIVLVPPARHLVIGKGARALRQARHGLAQLARRPTKLMLLLGGSLLITMSYVFALAACVQAYGGGISFVSIAAAYLVASAIGAAAPTPGGLGAVEAALYAALAVTGLNDAVALASVFTFRFATFWLPILPGWLAFDVLRRKEEL